MNYLVGAASNIQTQLTAKAAKGANTDITSLSGLTTPLSTGQGRTGQGSLSAAVQALLNAISTTQGRCCTEEQALGQLLRSEQRGSSSPPAGRERIPSMGASLRFAGGADPSSGCVEEDFLYAGLGLVSL